MAGREQLSNNEPERDQNTFRKKITELVKNPKIDPDADHTFITTYKKNDLQVSITMPSPGHKFEDVFGEGEGNPLNAMHVFILQDLPAQNNQSFTRHRHIALDLNNEEITYSEKFSEKDEKGKQIFSHILHALNQGEPLLENPISKEKFEEVMLLLNSLKPENEVV